MFKAARAATRELIIDAWSHVQYKAPLRDETEAAVKGWQPKSWLPEDAKRRLAAYLTLSAYDTNNARAFIDAEDADQVREYGDAALIIDQVLAHLLGETQEIVVDGAEKYDADLEAEVAEDVVAAEGMTDNEVAAAQTEREEIRAEQAEAAAAAELQEFLRAWADSIHLALRMVDCERNAVGLGDGVYLLGWDEQRGRPTCAVMEPDSYFPVLPDSIDGYDYPERVHFAWELPGEDFPDGKARLRRITYQLRRIMWLWDEEAEEWAQPANTKVATDGVTLLRDYPWRPGEPSEMTCYMTDATWLLDDATSGEAGAFDALTLDADGVVVAARDVDLEIDFVPVVHVPNTPAGRNHFGRSSLATVLQVLDDLQNTDTDSQRASATAGTPLISVSGVRMPEERGRQRGVDGDVRLGTPQRLAVEPGGVLSLGEHGRMDVLDTSAGLRELRAFTADLRDRLATNSRLPASALGMVNPEKVPSGYALELTFGPLTAMVRNMRLARSVKYPLLLKMVMRLYQANGKLEAGDLPVADVRFGAFLPADEAGVLERTVTAYEAKLISKETAVRRLVDVGFPIDDVSEELARIDARDYESANELADATNDQDAVRDFLGLDPAAPAREETEVPAVPLTLEVPPPGGRPTPDNDTGTSA